MKTKFGAACFMAVMLIVVAVAVMAGSDIEAFRTCGQCGMDRKAYDYSRMVISYTDGTQSGVCSLHCTVKELKKHTENEVASLQVADFNTRTLIDAKKAVWVMGGNKRGVMTKIPKWAFATKDTAHSFVDSFGGAISSWDSTLLAAQESKHMH